MVLIGPLRVEHGWGVEGVEGGGWRVEGVGCWVLGVRYRVEGAERGDEKAQAAPDQVPLQQHVCP